MTTFVVGVDPGLSCGWAAFRDAERVAYGQGDPDAAVPAVRELLRESAAGRPGVLTAIACERFLLPPRVGRRSAQLDALRVIGRLREVAHELGVPVMLQSPSDAARMDALVRDLDLRLTGRDVARADADDANSATRHALLWLAARNPRALDELMARHGR